MCYVKLSRKRTDFEKPSRDREAEKRAATVAEYDTLVFQTVSKFGISQFRVIGYLFQNMYTYNAKLNLKIAFLGMHKQQNKQIRQGALYLERHSNLCLDRQFVTWNWLSTKTSHRFYIATVLK